MSAYVTNSLRFPDPATEIDCEGLHEGVCVAAEGQPAFAIHTVHVRFLANEVRHLCAIHSPFSNIYVPCEACHTKPALPRLAEDGDTDEAAALCDDCIRELITEVAAAAFAPGPMLSVVEEEDDEDDEDDPDAGACPGVGLYCGNLIGPGVDVCGDCHMARLDRESPRIPR